MTNDVDSWFENYDNPMKEAMLLVRKIILEADSRMSECIKWQTPTFVFEGNLASFNARSKKHVSLMFHRGAEIPGDHPRLLGDGKQARSMKLKDLEEVEAARPDLEAVVAAWCAWRST